MRQTTLKLLIDKINGLRLTFSSNFLWGDNLRTLKTMQAHHILGLAAGQEVSMETFLVESFAHANNLSLEEAANVILQKATTFQEMLVDSEMKREILVARIRFSQSFDEIREIKKEISEL